MRWAFTESLAVVRCPRAVVRLREERSGRRSGGAELSMEFSRAIVGRSRRAGERGDGARRAAIVAGAGGWAAALVARAPVLALASRLGRTREAEVLVVLSSGPCEEGVRRLVVRRCGRSAQDPWLVGLGWAGVEIIGVLLGALRPADTDDGAEAMVPNDPSEEAVKLPWSARWTWIVVERAAAAAAHVGFTLWLASGRPLWPAALAHSFMNLSVVRMGSRSIAAAETAAVAGGILVLAAGAEAWGRSGRRQRGG